MGASQEQECNPGERTSFQRYRTRRIVEARPRPVCRVMSRRGRVQATTGAVAQHVTGANVGGSYRGASVWKHGPAFLQVGSCGRGRVRAKRGAMMLARLIIKTG